MATAAQVITASLNRILVRSADAPIESDEAEDFIFSMNNYMLALDADGVQLGYTEVSTVDDTITIPTGALRGLIANMAVEISPDFDGTITPGLALAAKQGLETMRKLGQSMGTTSYPWTLPIGSGNENDSGAWLWRHFYPQQESQILAETTGAISLEFSTNQVAESS